MDLKPHIEKFRQRFAELETVLSDPKTFANTTKSQELSREYARLRIGIGRTAGPRQITGHVLGRFSSTESDLADKVFAVASDQAECWLNDGTQKAMNQFNGTVVGPADERKEQ